MTGVQQALLMAGQSWIDPTWAQATAPAARRWRVASFGNVVGTGDVFIGGGVNSVTGNAVAMYSLDYGQTWTASPTVFSTSGNGFGLFKVAFGNGVFVAGIGLEIFVSSDGVNWSSAGFVADGHIEFGNGVFILAKQNANVCRRSTTGGAWGTIPLPSSDTWNGVGFGNTGSNGTWVIFSNTGCVISTDGGLNWSSGGALPFPTNVNSAAYGNGVWVASANQNDTVVYRSSTNGASWASHFVTSPSTVWQRVRFINGTFYMMSNGGARNVKSTDGITWTPCNSTVNTPSFSMDYDVCALPTGVRYVAVGNGGSNTTVTNYGIG